MKKSKKIISLLLAILIFTSVMFSDALSTEAATKKNKTVKSHVQMSFWNQNYKKAPAIKTGTTEVRLFKYNAMFKFTAPTTKTYKFTFSNLAFIGNEKKLISAEIRSYKPNGNNKTENTMKYVKLKSQGKKTSEIKINSNLVILPDSPPSAKIIKSNSGTIKLKKGETIYFSVGFGGTISSSRAKLNVKVQ